MLQSVPTAADRRGRAGLEHGGTTFRHFQSATATTDFVLGEFPWRVRAHDTVETSDFIAPPLLISVETTGDEKTWSLGEYTCQAIESGKPSRSLVPPPDAEGVFANQPSPYSGAMPYWTRFVALAALLLLLFATREVTAAREELFSQQYQFTPSAGEPAFVTEPFNLNSPGTVEVDIDTSVSNSWIYLDLALVNLDSGTALNVAREVGYYSGVDGDGRWTEGSSRAAIRLPAVACRPILPACRARGCRRRPGTRSRSAAMFRAWCPTLWRWRCSSSRRCWRRYGRCGFEHARWQESDYAK